MPSIMTLQGPQIGATTPTYSTQPQPDPLAKWVLLGLGVGVGALAFAYFLGQKEREKPLRGSGSMLDTIAREASSPEAYARRADAWNSAERDPVSQAKLVNAYLRTDPRGKSKLAAKLRRLLREAEEARLESRERMWSKMSKGLRGKGRSLMAEPGYRVAYALVTRRDGKIVTVRSIVDAPRALTLPEAEAWRRKWARTATAWVETMDGEHVPVKGAKRPAGFVDDARPGDVHATLTMPR